MFKHEKHKQDCFFIIGGRLQSSEIALEFVGHLDAHLRMAKWLMSPVTSFWKLQINDTLYY